MLEIISVYFLMSFSGGKAYNVSTHLTEIACNEAAITRLESDWFYAASCVPGYMRVVTKPEKIEEKNFHQPTIQKRLSHTGNGSCFGDDAFCGRNKIKRD